MKRILAAVLWISVTAFAGHATAQANYPEKPIRIVVGVQPGTQPDIVARLLGQKLSETLAKPVVVENVPGAAASIGTERVARAAPDGYTLALAGQPLVINPSLYKLPFDPVTAFAPISQLYVAPTLLVVNNAVPAKSVRELIALATARPGELTFVTGGGGSPPHLAGELFKSIARVDIREIRYKGGVVAAIPDLLGERVTMTFGTIATVLPMVREGKLRALAVTSLKRSSALPELPTVDESGVPGFELTAWGGLLAPAGTPATVVRKLHLETVKVLAQPDVRARFADLGLEIIGNSPDEFAAVIRSEVPKWARLIRESGIKAD